MATNISDHSVLNNGVKMPWLGLGVWKAKDGEEVTGAVRSAIESGYRSIDTAAVYGNEVGVGEGIRQAGIDRDQLFITTKVWNADQGYDSTLKAFDESVKRLGIETLDLYLIHWPVKGKYVETWRALEKLYRDGYVRAIGVSNFHTHHLEDLRQNSEIIPAVNQVEFHPLLTQKELLAYCQENGIQMEAWSPLMQGNLDHPLLVELGQKYGKSPAQIIIRWDLEKKVVTIPKSITPARIAQNADVFDFSLSAEDVEKINALNANKRFGADPDNFNF
ncbi:aldo/keto reductase [Brevibacillus centrosporus]|jgi:diketogulonate reductase-like aldo/keto reductase|uniref:Aldo/keto reductase n=1 Tax=Brevibacillus centrosporus TaxID=54910 RepID=A0A1I3VSV1_9BACL|nr:aldo/keto reductase [Brevibacillus centrosporus]MEC2130712.1 aldo/keto reductase [Brevibacillus centrosporus]MED1953229.1 aldo/keto reductase [Brevibacillus centrosporus]MED4908196.1 aldo/keto reductase [Brevibacillus centrosporus]RNB69250.1 aldo/keto reductase [Brevibacillus centrosporus]SFJ98315.1 Aldo/keto reductase [Brevibacillus centrosporus]